MSFDRSSRNRPDADEPVEFIELDSTGQPKNSPTPTPPTDAPPRSYTIIGGGSSEPTKQPPAPTQDGLSPQHIEQRINDVVQGLQGLEHLAELVSLRYNPFLEIDENDVFDGNRLPADQVIQGFFDPGVEGNGKRDADHPPFMEVAHVPRRTKGDELDESIDLRDLPLEELHSALGYPVDPPEYDDPEDEPDPPLPPVDTPPFTQENRARRTLLVLSWFRRLQEHVPPESLHLFVDHCHRMGWMDDACHAWIAALADGVATRNPDLTWSSLGLTPQQLTDIHEANLLFLDDLFTDRLRMGERRYLSRHIHEYFGRA